MEEPKGFENFWAAFPRRVAKQAAVRAYRKALKLTTSDELLKGATLYARERSGKETEFTKHPTTWLNGGCWADYVAAQYAQMVPGMPKAGFYASFCSPELKAWERYEISKNRKYPRDKRGGWYFPTQWPPEIGNGQQSGAEADQSDPRRNPGNDQKALGTGH